MKILAFLLLFFVPAQSVFAADGWKNLSSLRGEVSGQKRAGKIPVSISCRQDPAANPNLRKPQYKIRWSGNKSNKQWELLLRKKSSREDILVNAKTSQGLKRVSGIQFRTGAPGPFGYVRFGTNDEKPRTQRVV